MMERCAPDRESARWLVDIRVLKDSAGSKQLTTTPWKNYMEPTTHPFRKENDLPNLRDYVPC